MFSRGRLIRESEWMRVYECTEWGQVHESKFLTGSVEISAQSIISRWPSFSEEERLEFANAFAVKGEVTPEDERILNFLMEAGEPYIWMTMAPLLPRHRNRERVLRFVLEKISGNQHHNANFFQALELMADNRALPALRAAYDAYRGELDASSGPPKAFDYFDYLTCCRALWVLDGSRKYKDAIEALVKHPDARISAFARQALRDK